MSKTYDDVTLMAFADGQLDEPLFGEIADALEADPALARRLEMLVLGKDVSRAVYAPLADLPVPPQLTQAVRGAIAAHARAAEARQGRAGPWAGLAGLAVAACLGVVIAGPAGYLLGQQRPAPDGAGMQVGGLLAPDLAGRLHSLASGAEQPLADGTVMRAVATFADASGTLCREFEIDGASATVAVACRQDAQWRLTFALAAPLAPDGYAPAGALEALDAYLGSIGATAPMSRAEETAALRIL